MSNHIDEIMKIGYNYDLLSNEKPIEVISIASLYGDLALNDETVSGISSIDKIKKNDSYENISIFNRELQLTKGGQSCLTDKNLILVYKDICCYKIPLESIIWYTTKDGIKKESTLDIRPSILFNILLNDNSIKSVGFQFTKSVFKNFISNVNSAIIYRRICLINEIKKNSEDFQFVEPFENDKGMLESNNAHNKSAIQAFEADIIIKSNYNCNLMSGELFEDNYDVKGKEGDLKPNSDIIDETSNIKNLNEILLGKKWFKIQNNDEVSFSDGKVCITKNNLLCIFELTKEYYKIPLESIIHLEYENAEKKLLFSTPASVRFNVLLKDSSIKSFGFKFITIKDISNIITDLKDRIVMRREELINNLALNSGAINFKEPFEIDANEEYVQINPEYKRTCKICGNIWYSSVTRENEIEKGNFNDNAQSFLAIFYNHAAQAQYDKNIRDRKLALDSIRNCPNCHSNNYEQEIIEFIPKNITASVGQAQNTENIIPEKELTEKLNGDNPEELLKIRLAKGEISIEEYKELKDLISL